MTPLQRYSHLNHAFSSIEKWTSFFKDAPIPVMLNTAAALEALRVKEDDVDANSLGELISADPLMTLKVMAYASSVRPRKCPTQAETVTASLVMMGISPFFRAFGPQQTIDSTLAYIPGACAGLESVLKRAHRAASFALAFAVHRMDHDAAVIYQAALLHDFAEMLLWCHAPVLALQIQSAQHANVALRSRVAQRAVLNVELIDLQQSLMHAWELPELLIRITDDKHADHPSVRNVVLAMQLARHTSCGWDNAAIPDDIDEIAHLLNLSHSGVLEFIRGI